MCCAARMLAVAAGDHDVARRMPLVSLYGYEDVTPNIRVRTSKTTPTSMVRPIRFRAIVVTLVVLLELANENNRARRAFLFFHVAREGGLSHKESINKRR